MALVVERLPLMGAILIAMAMRVNRLVCTLPKTEDMGEQILSVDEGLQINARKRSKTRKKY